MKPLSNQNNGPIRFATAKDVPNEKRNPFREGISRVADPIGVDRGTDMVSPIGTSNLPLLRNRGFDRARFPVQGRRPTAMSTGLFQVLDRARGIGRPRSGGAAR